MMHHPELAVFGIKLTGNAQAVEMKHLVVKAVEILRSQNARTWPLDIEALKSTEPLRAVPPSL